MTNIQLDGNGNVVITARKETDGWHSGFLSAVPIGGYSGKRYIEARAKVAHGQGVWNGAIWEWAALYGQGGLENDICEQLGREPTKYHATVHDWAGGGQQNGHTITTSYTLGDGFHTYAAAVYADHIDYYFDGVKQATATTASVGMSSFTTWKVVPNVSLNMGGWGGTISPSLTQAQLTVDFVHVYALP